MSKNLKTKYIQSQGWPQLFHTGEGLSVFHFISFCSTFQWIVSSLLAFVYKILNLFIIFMNHLISARSGRTTFWWNWDKDLTIIKLLFLIHNFLICQKWTLISLIMTIEVITHFKTCNAFLRLYVYFGNMMILLLVNAVSHSRVVFWLNSCESLNERNLFSRKNIYW